MKIKIFILTSIIIISTGCNENFWGYNYDAPALINVTRIQGNISDKFSGNPIQPATININGQETLTDEFGNFLLNYVIPDDIEPNQPEVGYLTIIALNYLPYSTTFIIYPIENTVNIELEYAPPIVLNAVSHGDTTQAIIKDYQSTNDINFVSVTFLEDTGSGVWIRKEFEMNKMNNIDINTAYYQFVVDSVTIMNLSRISDWFRITARDKSENIHMVSFTIHPDSSLFF
jgi:hypothetical protein